MTPRSARQPWLSVITPTYNGDDYLEAALSSLAAQADDGVECIVVDDGSTDESVAIARSFQTRMPLEVVVGERRGNWAGTTNVGMQRARGQWISFLHQDDLWGAGRLEGVRRLVDLAPAAAFVFHAAWYIDHRGRRVGRWRAPYRGGPHILTPAEFLPRLLIQNFVSIVGPAFRRDVALAGGGLDESLWYTADWDLWLRLATAGPTVYSSELLASFRIHAESQTARRSMDVEAFRTQHTAVLDRYLPGLPATAAVKERLRRVATAGVDLNVALAALSHGDRSQLAQGALSVGRLGPRGWGRLARDARLFDRVGSRLKVRGPR